MLLCKRMTLQHVKFTLIFNKSEMGFMPLTMLCKVILELVLVLVSGLHFQLRGCITHIPGKRDDVLWGLTLV